MRIKRANNQKKDDPTESADVDPAVDASNEYRMDSLLFLKTTVVTDKNVTEFQKHLEITLTNRLKMISDDSTDFLEEFPFFFVRPALVSIL